jgi:hypothetical protein
MQEFRVYGFLNKLTKRNSEVVFIRKYYDLNIYNMTFIEKTDPNSSEFDQLFGYKQLSHFTVALSLEEAKMSNYQLGFKLVLTDSISNDGEKEFLLFCKGFKDLKMWAEGFREFFNKKQNKSKGVYINPNSNQQKSSKRSMRMLTMNYYIKSFLDTFSLSMIGDVKLAPGFSYSTALNKKLMTNSKYCQIYNNFTVNYGKSLVNQTKLNQTKMLNLTNMNVLNDIQEEVKETEIIKQLAIYYKLLFKDNNTEWNTLHINKKNDYNTNNKPNMNTSVNISNINVNSNNKQSNSFIGRVSCEIDSMHPLQIRIRKRSNSYTDFKKRPVHIGKLRSIYLTTEYSLSVLLDRFLKGKMEWLMPIQRKNFNKDTSKFYYFIKSLKITENYLNTKFIILLTNCLSYIKTNYKSFKAKNKLKELKSKIDNEWEDEIETWKDNVGLCSKNKNFLLKERKLLGDDYHIKVTKANYINKRDDKLAKINQELNKEFSDENIERFLTTKKLKYTPQMYLDKDKLNYQSNLNYASINNKKKATTLPENCTKVRLLDQGKNFTMEFTVNQTKEKKESKEVQMKKDKELLFIHHFPKVKTQIDAIHFFDEKLDEIDNDINNIIGEDPSEPYFHSRIGDNRLSYNYDFDYNKDNINEFNLKSDRSDDNNTDYKKSNKLGKNFKEDIVVSYLEKKEKNKLSKHVKTNQVEEIDKNNSKDGLSDLEIFNSINVVKENKNDNIKDNKANAKKINENATKRGRDIKTKHELLQEVKLSNSKSKKKNNNENKNKFGYNDDLMSDQSMSLSITSDIEINKNKKKEVDEISRDMNKTVKIRSNSPTFGNISIIAQRYNKMDMVDSWKQVINKK